MTTANWLPELFPPPSDVLALIDGLDKLLDFAKSRSQRKAAIAALLSIQFGRFKLSQYNEIEFRDSLRGWHDFEGFDSESASRIIAAMKAVVGLCEKLEADDRNQDDETYLEIHSVHDEILTAYCLNRRDYGKNWNEPEPTDFLTRSIDATQLVNPPSYDPFKRLAEIELVAGFKASDLVDPIPICDAWERWLEMKQHATRNVTFIEWLQAFEPSIFYFSFLTTNEHASPETPVGQPGTQATKTIEQVSEETQFFGPWSDWEKKKTCNDVHDISWDGLVKRAAKPMPDIEIETRLGNVQEYRWRRRKQSRQVR